MFVYSNCSAVLVSHVCVVFRVLVCVRLVRVWCLRLFDSRAVASWYIVCARANVFISVATLFRFAAAVVRGCPPTRVVHTRCPFLGEAMV